MTSTFRVLLSLQLSSFEDLYFRMSIKCLVPELWVLAGSPHTVTDAALLWVLLYDPLQSRKAVSVYAMELGLSLFFYSWPILLCLQDKQAYDPGPGPETSTYKKDIVSETGRPDSLWEDFYLPQLTNHAQGVTWRPMTPPGPWPSSSLQNEQDLWYKAVRTAWDQISPVLGLPSLLESNLSEKLASLWIHTSANS